MIDNCDKGVYMLPLDVALHIVMRYYTIDHNNNPLDVNITRAYVYVGIVSARLYDTYAM